MSHRSRYKLVDWDLLKKGEQVGRGGFATVFKGEYRGQTVAIKQIDKANQIAKGWNPINEIEIHKSLDHPSILKFIDYFEDEDCYYLILEFCDKGSLEQVFERKNNQPFSEPDAYYIVKQIAEGLYYLRDKHIIHRDLKLQNILLTDCSKCHMSFQVKITDFGISAKLKHDNEDRRTMVGTPRFMSPEIIKNGQQGYQTDCWGLGCILYRLLFGEFPFKSANFHDDIIYKDVKFPATPNSNLIEKAKKLILRLLHKNLKERPSIEEIFASEFFQSFPPNPRDCRCKAVNLESSDSGRGLSINSRKSRYSESLSAKDRSSSRHSTRSNSKSSCNSWDNLSHKEKPRAKISSSRTENERNYRSYEKYKNKVQTLPNFLPRQPPPHRKRSSSCDAAGKSIHQDRSSDSCWIEPLNTKRLKYKRIVRSTKVVTVTDDGKIYQEFFKTEHNTKCITKIYCVSDDGLEVWVYEPKRKLVLGDTFEPLENHHSVKHFRLQTLPEKLRKDYMIAKQIVEVLKESTPKVTLHGNYAKCVMYENLPDPNFFLQFYNGTSISKTKKGIQLTYNNGRTSKFDDIYEFNRNSEGLCSDFKEMVRACEDLNQMLENYEDISGTPVFPAVIGQRRKVLGDPQLETYLQKLQMSRNRDTGYNDVDSTDRRWCRKM